MLEENYESVKEPPSFITSVRVEVQDKKKVNDK